MSTDAFLTILSSLDTADSKKGQYPTVFGPSSKLNTGSRSALAVSSSEIPTIVDGSHSAPTSDDSMVYVIDPSPPPPQDRSRPKADLIKDRKVRQIYTEQLNTGSSPLTSANRTLDLSNLNNSFMKMVTNWGGSEWSLDMAHKVC